jgi:hypothetical protein
VWPLQPSEITANEPAAGPPTDTDWTLSGMTPVLVIVTVRGDGGDPPALTTPKSVGSGEIEMPAGRSRTKTSRTALVSPATRFGASDSKATTPPSPSVAGARLDPLPWAGPGPTEMRDVRPLVIP